MKCWNRFREITKFLFPLIWKLRGLKITKPVCENFVSPNHDVGYIVALTYRNKLHPFRLFKLVNVVENLKFINWVVYAYLRFQNDLYLAINSGEKIEEVILYFKLQLKNILYLNRLIFFMILNWGKFLQHVISKILTRNSCLISCSFHIL